MRELNIAMCVLEQEDLLLFQLRCSEPRLGAAGLFGCFGGKVEPGETPAQAAVRELGEETNLALEPADLRMIGDVSVESDRDNEPVKVFSTVFHKTLQRIDIVEAKEGSLYKIHKDRVGEYYDRMTPATRALFEEYSIGEV
ncbi:MAG: NUDIX domain-containing protein [Candidatus Saccharimonadales bacterium]